MSIFNESVETFLTRSKNTVLKNKTNIFLKEINSTIYFGILFIFVLKKTKYLFDTLKS